MKLDIKENRKRFINLLRSSAENKDDLAHLIDLINYLDSEGFFIAPCSKGHHLNIDGGLCFHSLSVMKVAYDLNKILGEPYSLNLIKKAALLHDVCKIFDYEKVNGEWNYKNNEYPKEHGKKSVRILKKFILVEDELEEMILWHMGVYSEYYDGHQKGDFLKWSSIREDNYVNAALFLYFCDHLSTIFMEG